MRKFLIAAAVATSAIAAATPAAAQYYPGQNYGYNNGYNNRAVRNYLVRADQLRNRIEQLDSRNRISEHEARWLRSHAIDLQQRTRGYARNGLSGSERRDLDQRFAWLQQHLRRDVRDGNRWGNDGWNRNNGQRRVDHDGDGIYDHRDRWVDYDRDGRDDRQERRQRDRYDD